MDGKLKSLVLLFPAPLTYWLLHGYLDSTGGWLLLGFYAAVPLLAVLGEFLPEWKKSVYGLAVLLMISLGVLLIWEVLLLPYQAYELWFDLFRSSLERGRVSHLFVKLGTLLMTIVSWMIYRQPRPLEGIKRFIHIPFFFLFLLWPSGWAALGFLTALLAGRLKKENYKEVLTLLLVVFFFGLTGLKSPAKGARFIDNRSGDFIVWLTETWPTLPILYDIPLYGESFSHTVETGGRPVLTSRTILTVEGRPGEQIYLRTGTGVSPGDRGRSLRIDELPRAEREITEGLPYHTVRIMTDFINFLPYTEEADYLAFRGEYYPLSESDKALIPDPPLFMGDGYTLLEEKERSLRLEGEEFDFTPYLAPQNEPSDELKQLAAALAGEDDRTTADNIRRYLADNYVYSLDTEESSRYTEDFLFSTGEGYCLHFATAFAALARLNGIPCRMVQGYLVIFPDEENYWENYGHVPLRATVGVTGLSSHLWPEIYLADSGWTSYEATSPFYRPGSPTAGDSLTSRQLHDIRSEDEMVRDVEEKEGIPPVLYLAIPLIILMARLISRAGGLIRRYGKNTLFVIRRYVSLAYSAGIDRPGEEGWMEWYGHVSHDMPRTKELMDQAFPLILRARYAPEPLDEEGKDKLHNLLKDFKKECRRIRRR